MAGKPYLVQCWDSAGALVNNYETLIQTQQERNALKKFLETKHSHVLITAADKPRTRR